MIKSDENQFEEKTNDKAYMNDNRDRLQSDENQAEHEKMAKASMGNEGELESMHKDDVMQNENQDDQQNDPDEDPSVVELRKNSRQSISYS